MSQSPAPSAKAGFPLVLGISAFLIAGCSAFFSVRGLGLLFAGSEWPVMIMAATLEIGKLVAASFLYRYWGSIQAALKFYLTLALVVLVGVTSLGNYGYLARAYERANADIAVAESQIKSMESEVVDIQARIEASRGVNSQSIGISREDLARAQARVAFERDALSQSITRIEAARAAANERRATAARASAERNAAQADALSKAVTADEASIASLLKRVEVLDRAVDAYTQQGNSGLFNLSDGVRKGQDLREQQSAERNAIAAELERTRTRIERLRDDQLKQAAEIAAEMKVVDEALRQDLLKLDAEFAEADKKGAAAVAAAEENFAALEAQSKKTANVGEAKVDQLHELVRRRTQEIQNLRNQITRSDIGTYRFVARAFDVTADEVVKWLIVLLVLVFDPLAVTLVVAFNVALLRGNEPKPAALPSSPASASRLWIVGLSVALLSVIIAWLVWPRGATLFGNLPREHTRLIPGDSFAVLTFRPESPPVARKLPPDPNRSMVVSSEPVKVAAVPKADPALEAWLDWVGGPVATQALNDLLGNGLDANAEVFAFAKFPIRLTAGKDGRPVVICGLVLRITDPVAAESALSRLSDKIRAGLRGDASPAGDLSRNRAMIRYADGRYLDPQGGFFTFGVTADSAILMVEFEGDPVTPCIGQEMRNCLALASGQAEVAETLPTIAYSSDASISLWLNSGRFFRRLPMDAPTRKRFAQLRANVDFDMIVGMRTVSADQVKIVARYEYPGERPAALAPEVVRGDDAAQNLVGRLLQRCSDSLEFDAFAERLRLAFGEGNPAGIRQVVVEKSSPSPQVAQFTVSTRVENGAARPMVGVLQSLLR